MIGQKKVHYSLEQIATQLNVRVPHLKYLEKQFQEIRSTKNQDDVPYYQSQDLLLFQTIYHLIYNKNYTIHKVKKLLLENKEDIFSLFSEKSKLFTEKNSLSKMNIHEDIDIDLEKNHILGQINIENDGDYNGTLCKIMQEIMDCKRILESEKEEIIRN